MPIEQYIIHVRQTEYVRHYLVLSCIPATMRGNISYIVYTAVARLHCSVIAV